MKITALGVNSAFSTGEYRQAISIEKLGSLVDSFREKKGENRMSIKSFLARAEEESSLMYDPRWQSNFLIEFSGPEKVYRLVLDFGGDIRHALKGAGYSFNDIDGFYCSHPHADHIGGVEGVALTHIFNPFYRSGKAEWLKNIHTGELDPVARRLADGESIPAEYKPDLYCHEYVLDELWTAAKPGLQTIQGVPQVNLRTYFNVMPMQDNHPVVFHEEGCSWKLYTVTSVHVNAGYRQMPSFGLMFESSDGRVVFMPTDTQFMSPRQVKLYYDRADVIFQDCETGPRSDVHPHIDDLKTLPPEIKKKCYLYHFSERPEIDEGEFGAILETGQSFEL